MHSASCGGGVRPSVCMSVTELIIEQLALNPTDSILRKTNTEDIQDGAKKAGPSYLIANILKTP